LAGADADDPEDTTEAHMKSWRVHRILSWLYGLIALMLLALPFAILAADEALSSGELIRAFVFPALFVALFVLHYLVSRGARERKPWARIGSIILACLLVPGIPLGTIIGVYLLVNSSWQTRSAAAPAM
jgi:cytochrome bd-type quinol oxidase subunit 2